MNNFVFNLELTKTLLNFANEIWKACSRKKKLESKVPDNVHFLQGV